MGTVLVFVGLAAVWTWQTTPHYSSTTRLFVSTSQADENSAYPGKLFATQRVASYADLVTSNQLAERVGRARRRPVRRLRDDGQRDQRARDGAPGDHRHDADPGWRATSPRPTPSSSLVDELETPGGETPRS